MYTIFHQGECPTIVGREGTATKFIDNAPGGMVPRVDPNRKGNEPLERIISEIWQKYSAEEKAIFNRLFTTFEKACMGKLSKEELNQEMREYWLTGISGRIYFLGSEMFGAIYHGLGKQACFDAMRDPRKIFDFYNKAIDKNPKLLGQCIRIPDRLVKMAQSLGK
jgi:hypothetical protein